MNNDEPTDADVLAVFDILAGNNKEGVVSKIRPEKAMSLVRSVMIAYNQFQKRSNQT